MIRRMALSPPARPAPGSRAARAVSSAPVAGAGVALAALAAVAAFATYRREPGGAAEAAYLGTLAAVVLAAAAAAAPRPRLEAGVGAVLAVAAVWLLPAGTGRGAVVGLLLVAAVAGAAARRLAGAAGAPGLGTLIPLALGAQTLLRGEHWLGPVLELRPLVILVGLPVVGAVAIRVLSRRQPPDLVLTAAATILLLAPGFNVAVTLSLVVLAAGSEAFHGDLPRPARLAALALLAVPVAWEPESGLVMAAAGLALGGTVPALAAAVAGLVMALATPLRSWPEALELLAWVPLLLPALVLPGRERWPRLAAALALALAAARVGPPGALAAPLILAALCLAPSRPLAVAQGAWSGLLLAGTALLATYPWLRQAPAGDFLALAGVEVGWPAALGVLAVALLTAATGRKRAWSRVAALGLMGVALGVTFVLAHDLPPRGRVLVQGEPVVVSAEHRQRALWLDQGSVSEVVYDSHLVHGAALPRGTLVATFRLRDAAGEVYEHPVRVGEETGEWAARRPDVAALPGLAVPPPWRVHLDPGGELFVQTYRAWWRLPEPLRPVRVEVERAPDLPQKVVLLLFRVELRP